MLKRFFLALALSAGLLSPAYTAGTIPFSLSQQLDSSGKPLAGCQFYTIQAGTTSTPQTAYQDSALTLPLPNPQTCDAAGRLPQFFLADGQIKVRLTDRNGISVVTADNIQVVGASSGSGGGGVVDPTTVLTTGDIKVAYGTNVLSGFVRANGRTIGSATSGATERANADCQSLFQYLWAADPNLAVSGGRGASAAADWAANKTIALPDGRGSVLAGLDDMGNTAAGKFGSVPFIAGNATTLGSRLGLTSQTIAQAQLPNVTVSASVSGTVSVASALTYFQTSLGPVVITDGSGASNHIAPPAGSTTGATTVSSSGFNTLSGNTSSINGNVTQTGLPTIQPTLLATIYIKL